MNIWSDSSVLASFQLRALAMHGCFSHSHTHTMGKKAWLSCAYRWLHCEFRGQPLLNVSRWKCQLSVHTSKFSINRHQLCPSALSLLTGSWGEGWGAVRWGGVGWGGGWYHDLSSCHGMGPGGNQAVFLDSQMGTFFKRPNG